MKWRHGALLALAALLFACSDHREKAAEYMESAAAATAAGDHKEALLALRSALRVAPDDPEVTYRLASVLASQGNTSEAIFFFRETRRLDPSRTDAALDEAIFLFRDDPGSAAQLIDSVLEREPDNALAHLRRSALAVLHSRPKLALAHAERALEITPEDPQAHWHMGSVHEAFIRQRQLEGGSAEDDTFETALLAFERAAELNGNDPASASRALLKRAKIYSSWPGHVDQVPTALEAAFEQAAGSGDPEESRRVARYAVKLARDLEDPALQQWALRKNLEVEPGNVQAWIRLADLEADAGRDPEAVYRELLEARPADFRGHLAYVRFLAVTKRPEDAVAHLRRETTLNLDPPAALAEAANLMYRYQVGDPDEADQIVDRLEAEFPTHPRTQLAVAQREFRSGRADEAAVVLRQLVRENESPDALRLLASAERKIGNLEAAQHAINRTIELEPGFSLNSHAVRAEISHDAGRWRDALQDLRAIHSRGAPLSQGQRVMLVRCLYESGRRIRGLRALLKLLSEPNPPTLAVLEFAAREGGEQPERARQLLIAAHARSPLNTDIMRNLIRFDLAAGEGDVALERLNQVIEAGGVPAGILLMRARLLAQRGESAMALQDAVQAFNAAPNLLGAAHLVVELYQREGQLLEAIGSFEEAQKVGALPVSGRLILARLYLTTDQRDKAKAMLESVIAEREDLPGAKNDLAYLLAQEGIDLERAELLALEAGTRLKGSPHIADTLGLIYMQRAMHGQALGHFDEAVELALSESAPNPLFYYHKGLAHRALDEHEEALESFTTAVEMGTEFPGSEDARNEVTRLRNALAPDPS